MFRTSLAFEGNIYITIRLSVMHSEGSRYDRLKEVLYA